MSQLNPEVSSSTPERAILQLLLDAMITTTVASNYLASYDYWVANYSSFTQNTWVGVWNGQTFTGNTPLDVSDAIFASYPNAAPYIGFVQS